MPRPPCRDDGVHLGLAGDAEDGHCAVGAEARRGVRAPLDFGVDFRAGGEEARVLRDAARVGSVGQSGPGGGDVVRGGAAGGVDEGDDGVEEFFCVLLEGWGHVGEGREPF